MTAKPVFTIREDDKNSVHTVVTIFNRGANSGTLCLLTEDVPLFKRLLEGGEWRRGGQRVEYEVGDG